MNNSIPKIYGLTGYSNKCKLHNDIYINRGLPCPYPNCENGIRESNKFSKIHDYRFINNKYEEKQDIYLRKEFKGINGDSKYIWLIESDPFPSISNIIFNEISIINKIDIGKTIFHYTKLENLYSILDSNELWLVQYDMQEDTQEVIYGFELFNKSIDCRVDISKRFNSKRLNFFLTCFSFESEYKYLFDNYADNSKGVSIEFFLNPSFWFSDIQFLHLMPVIYDNDIQKEIIEYCKYLFEVSENWIKESNDWFVKKNELVSKEERIKITKELFVSLMEELLPFFKHYEFKEEKEVRWLYKIDKDFFDKHIGETLDVRKNININKKYYTSTDIARKLCLFEDEINLKLPIKSITIGCNVENKNEVINRIKNKCIELGFNDIEIKISKDIIK